MRLQGYLETRMAADLHRIVKTDLKITDPVHVVGHNIGGKIAHAYAALFPSEIASVAWGECLLLGSTFYEQAKETVQLWHFMFHRITDLPEMLIAGKERAYIKHFYDKLSRNCAAIAPADVDLYAKAYSQAGAIRAGMNVYRMFSEDAKENLQIRDKSGKPKVRCLALNGDHSFLAEKVCEEAGEFFEDFEVATVADAGHYIAEENPRGFVHELLKFVDKAA